MRYCRYIIIILIQAALCVTLTGQNFTKAKKLAHSYNYSEAIPLLKKITGKDTEFKTEALVLLGDCYRQTNDYARAGKYYGQAIDRQDSIPVEVYLHYGQVLRTQQKYTEAKKQFDNYASLAPDDPRGNLLSSHCNNITPWLSSKAVRVYNVASLNSSYADFSPVFHGDGAVVITTEKPRGKASGKIYQWTGKPYLNLQKANLTGVMSSGKPVFEEPFIFDNKLLDDYHDGIVTFSPDGNTLFLTRTVQGKVPKDEERFRTHFLKLYHSQYDGEQWSKPKAFELNSDDYSVGHPAFSPDGEDLYFVSDIPDGFGGTDIYVCHKQGDTAWSPAENLGPGINTVMDEMFPYIDRGGRLYFSSDGHLGFGGLDIFYTEYTEGAWLSPTNLMKGVNSSYDDFGISINEELHIGMFSSNRPGGLGSDDIYAWAHEGGYMDICGYVKTPEGEPIVGATVFFADHSADEVLILKTDSKGKYCAEVLLNRTYNILAKKTAYRDDCMEHKIKQESVNPKALVLSPYKTGQVFEVENIYYDLDEWFIRPDAEPSLDNLIWLLKEHPVTVELSSHTDCRASDGYNIELSQKRAESAVRYILLQGVHYSRITAKGYGEAQLVNECADGVKCTEEQHQDNRRTEFKIMSVDKIQKTDWNKKYAEGQRIPLEELHRDFFRMCD